MSMKPSEIITRVSRLYDEAASHDDAAAEHEDKAKFHYRRAISLRAQHRALLDQIDASAPWSEIEAALTTPSDPVTPTPADAPSAEPKRERKQRSDAGKPRQRVTAPESRLNDHCRAIINEQLAAGPTTISIFSVATGWSPDETEALLTEDPASYVRYLGQREGDSAPVILWGTWEQFYQAAQVHSNLRALQPTPADTKVVMDLMGCSGLHAKRAIDEARKTT